jgi:hypothetical protein
MSLIIPVILILASAVVAQPAVADVLHDLDQLYRSDNSHSKIPVLARR